MTISKNQEAFLYPPIEPRCIHRLAVSDRHTVVYEEVGDANGKPALFLHGGPGVGIQPDYRRFFDPAFYRTILVDQRGAGRSTPSADIKDNTTWDIVRDLELLRTHLGIKDWVVMGGSWGSLLALCYAIKHPSSVAALIIRGVLLGRQSEIDWLHTEVGAARIYPDEWAKFIEPLAGRSDVVNAYCEQLQSSDSEVANAAAKSWTRWEAAMMTLFPDPTAIAQLLTDHSALCIARLEAHYTANNFFLPSDNYILENAVAIERIPCRIIHGRYDIVCPPISAWQLHHKLPNSTLTIVPDGAHSPLDGGMTSKLVSAADEFKLPH